MDPLRRGLILGGGVATVLSPLVRAEASDLLAMPRGLGAAVKWSQGQFSEAPGCRVVYSDGQVTKWAYYPSLRREPRLGVAATYIVAIEVCATELDGRRAINTVPIDGVGLYEKKKEAHRLASMNKQIPAWRKFIKDLA